MFNLSDFYQLPQFKPLLARLVNDQKPGVTILAGIDAHAQQNSRQASPLLPSGRKAFFETLFHQILASQTDQKAIPVTQGKSFGRLPREIKDRLRLVSSDTSADLTRPLSEAIRTKAKLIAVDQLELENLPMVFDAASRGMRVLAQLDTSLWGYEVFRHLADLGLTSEHVADLQWILTIRRLPALCSSCRRPVLPNPELFSRLRLRFPGLLDSADDVGFFEAIGCKACKGKGRLGDILAFDLYSAHAPDKAGVEQASLFPLESYLLQLAMQGYLALEDLVFFEADQRKILYSLYASSTQSLDETGASLKRKLAELEAANQVLLKRTEVLISLQDTVQLLASSASLEELAGRVCQRAKDLCGADRAILYYLTSALGEAGKAQILAVAGWDPGLLRQTVSSDLVLDSRLGNQPSPCNAMPARGLPPTYQLENISLQAGVQVPLTVQDQRIGLMIIHSEKKKWFTPGETSLLQTFASQASLAIQRAGLIEELRQKIKQLEAAQADLLEKERLEHELELARRVQQSVLPKVFPDVPGFAFAAHNSPARQVGGDFYDVLVLDEDHFGLIIADVSDKGMPAALYMALTRSLLLAESRRSLSPLEVLTQVNQLLLELGGFTQFVSVFYGIMEISSQRLVYTRAGHDRPLLLRQGAIHPLTGSGAVLGVLDQQELRLSHENIQLKSGDRLFLYTDGLIDAISHENEFYGLERLLAFLQEQSTATAKELCDASFEKMNQYTQVADQYDDVTVLVLEVQ